MAELFQWIHIHAPVLIITTLAINGYTISTALSRQQHLGGTMSSN